MPRAGRAWLLLLLALPGAGLSAPADEEVRRTWQGAQVFVRIEDPDYRLVVIDGRIDSPHMRRILAGVAKGGPRGAIVHLHGCAYGTGDMDVRGQARFMASLGYVVFVPNSFLRRNRPATCDPARHEGLPDAPYGAVHRMRREELDYALGQVLALPWLDRRHLFVSGFSEGGNTVVDYSHPAVRGRIAIGASCWLGVDRSRATPTLVITSRRDPWYDEARWPGARGLCRRQFGAWPHAEVIEPDGALHEALIYGESRIALGYFLVRAGR